MFIFSSILLLFVSCESFTEREITSFDTPESFASDLITLESVSIVEKIGDYYVWGGDMILSPSQLDVLNKTGDIFENDHSKFGPNLSFHPVFNTIENYTSENVSTRALGFSPTSYNTWTMVRFSYGTSLNLSGQIRVLNALNIIEAQTNVRFYNATGQPTIDPITGFSYPYVEFERIDGTVSYSNVGLIGGRQQISITDGATVGNVIHEICHALGMLHEFIRQDRDTYVTVNTANLKPDGVALFVKRTTNFYMLGDYDFNSIMCYSSITGQTNWVYDINQPTHTKKNGDLLTSNDNLSDNDLLSSALNCVYITI